MDNIAFPERISIDRRAILYENKLERVRYMYKEKKRKREKNNK